MLVAPVLQIIGSGEVLKRKRAGHRSDSTDVIVAKFTPQYLSHFKRFTYYKLN
jgi:hypothetical protein